MSIIVRYNFSTPDESSLYSLDYKILENDFTDRWLQALQYELNCKRPMQQNGFYGSRFINEAELRLKMQQCIDTINAPSSEGPWLESSIYPNMGHEYLMKIHEEFEKLVKDPIFMSLSAPSQRKDAIFYLNKLIHNYEDLNLGNRNHFHLDVLFSNPNGWCLEEEDYKLFEIDLKYGGIYLDYGVTGVPILSAFLNNVKQRPTPQYNLKAGVKLIFFNAIYNNDPFRNELKLWLAKKWQMDIKDPKLAIGHIPLGRLVGESDADKIGGELEKHSVMKSPEILDSMTLHPVRIPYISSQMRKYSSLFPKRRKKSQMEKILNPQANWPTHIDIHNYLSFRPWIKLPWRFSPKSCYEEVINLLDRFVPHRNYDVDENSKNGWRSLGIKAQNGIATNTYAHTHYNEESNYQLTDIVKDCPKTIKMLSSITDIKQCHRIRWMLLMPGTKISAHSDKQKEDDDVCLALNIALNMPDECHFWIDTQKNGEHERFTRKIPIQGGDAILLNNAKYHYVENNSDKIRIHIIVHGPIRMSDETLLESARNQCKIHDHKILINQIVVKKALQRSPLDKHSSWYQQWIVSGISTPFFPDDIKVLLLKDDIEDKKILHEALYQFTQASLIHEPHLILDYSRIDEELPLLRKSGKRFIVFIGAGTFLPGFQKFAYALLQTIGLMDKKKAPASAHIIDHPNRSKGLPFFHEQFFILDLERWDEIGRPKINKPYSAELVDFPKNYIKGKSFHDDYTPQFLAPNPNDSSPEYEHGIGGLGTVFMAESLKNNLTIINIPTKLRNKKIFSYPRAGICKQMLQVEKEKLKILKREQERIFVFNNENLYDPFFRSISHFKPKSLYSVASGLKPYALLEDIHQRTQQIPALYFFDSSKNALNYHREIRNIHNKDKFIFYLAEKLSLYQFAEDQNNNDNLNKAAKIASQKFHQFLETSFCNNFDYFYEIFQSVGTCFTHVNIITNPEALIEKINPDEKFMIWISNIWCTQASFFNVGRQNLNKNFIDFIRAVGEKINMRSWVSINNGLYNGFWGKSKDEIYGIITCGNGPIDLTDFRPIAPSPMVSKLQNKETSKPDFNVL